MMSYKGSAKIAVQLVTVVLCCKTLFSNKISQTCKLEISDRQLFFTTVCAV